LVSGAAKYKSLVVGTETIDPATLTTKAHANCKPKKTAAAPKKKSATATTGTTTVPATTTMPTTTPSMTPATK
jgi:hypothetical protein